MGTIHGIQTFVPIMLKQKEICHIINTSAGAGFLTGQDLSAYKASKHAITAISEVLLADLKQINANINVSVLIPHWVNTDMPKKLKTDNHKIIADYLEQLKTHGMPTSLVADIVFEGIRKNQFYLFTHPNEHLPKIQKRMENIIKMHIE